MPGIQLPGLQTGIDTSAIISQLMAAERRTINTLEERKGRWDERQEALSDIESKVRSLRTRMRSLSNADVLKAFSVSSSDSDILTAEATNDAFEGNHAVEVSQLAASERSVHVTGVEYVEDYVGAGTFIYSYNHQETSVTTTATTPLDEFIELIHNDADKPGVKASLLY